MSNQSTCRASCFCGEVQITLLGHAELQAYCHCDSCRRWSGGPFSAFTLWQPGNVEVTRGLDKIAEFGGNPGSDHEGLVSNRKWCRCCGGHVFTDHPAMGLVDVPAAVIEDYAFAPVLHVHYQESVHRVTDGLTKFRDLPEAAGGSGLELAE